CAPPKPDDPPTRHGRRTAPSAGPASAPTGARRRPGRSIPPRLTCANAQRLDTSTPTKRPYICGPTYRQRAPTDHRPRGHDTAHHTTTKGTVMPDTTTTTTTASSTD